MLIVANCYLCTTVYFCLIYLVTNYVNCIFFISAIYGDLRLSYCAHCSIAVS